MDTIHSRILRGRGSALQFPCHGFWPPTHPGGRGPNNRLKILCLHDKHRNVYCMEKEVERMFLSDARLMSWVSLEYLDSPHAVPEEDAPDFAAFGRLYGGSPRIWHGGENRLGRLDDWPLLPESLRFVIDHIRRNGPYDGLCGFGQGADLLAIMAMLAQEGEGKLQGKFKFLVVVSAVWPKRPSWRPRAPLKVPTCHVYETNGHYSMSDFEHLILHWDPAFREVIVHDQRHEIPRLVGDGLMAFVAFLKSFHSDQPWLPMNNAIDGPVFPMPLQIQKPPRTSPPRRLVIACFHDVQPGSCTPGVFDKLTAAILQDQDLSCRLALDPPDLSRYVVLEDLKSAEKPPCARYESCHVVSKLNVKAANEIVRCFLKHNLNETPVLVLGIGIGAYIGLVYAMALKEIGGFPWLLYAVRPPVVFPLPENGCLGSCDITCLVPDEDRGGERWRLEAATSGRFQTEAYHAEDGDAGWTEALVRSLKVRAPLQASAAW